MTAAERNRRRARKTARREKRIAKGKTTVGTRRRAAKMAERAVDAMRMNQELLDQRTSQAKRSDKAHNREAKRRRRHRSAQERDGTIPTRDFDPRNATWPGPARSRGRRAYKKARAAR